MWRCGDRREYYHRGELLHSPVRVWDARAAAFSETRYPLRAIAQHAAAARQAAYVLQFDAPRAAAVREFMRLNSIPCDDLMPISTDRSSVIVLHTGAGRVPHNSQALAISAEEALQPALRYLIARGNEDAAVRFIEEFPLAGLSDTDGGVPLLSLAIAAGMPALVDELLALGAHAGDARTRWHPLVTAVRYGDAATARILCRTPCSERVRVRAVFEAVIRTDVPLLTTLRDAGMHLDAVTDQGGERVFAVCAAARLLDPEQGQSVEACALLLSGARVSSLGAALSSSMYLGRAARTLLQTLVLREIAGRECDAACAELLERWRTRLAVCANPEFIRASFAHGRSAELAAAADSL